MHVYAGILNCPDPVAPANGEVSFSGNGIGDTATFTCNERYELVGEATTSCTAADDGESATFQPAPPIRQRMFAFFVPYRLQSSWVSN